MTKIPSLLLLVFAVSVLVVEAQNPYCERCSLHTMCRTRRDGRTCYGKSLETKPPSQAEKTAILHSHNRLRNMVARGDETRGKGGGQLSATNMMMMEWDNELASIAQRAADQCIYGHDCAQCRTLERDGKGVGQNVAIQYDYYKPKAVNWTGMVEDFYLTEVHLMPPSYASSYVFDFRYGHYSQMVWWNSRLVGCGASMYREGSWYRTLIFCNYRSSANFDGAQVYEVGPSGSNCPTGTRASNSEYSALCAIQGTDTRSTFHTDGQLLGVPEGTYALPGRCEYSGFRLY